ncbi:hypothetical protein Y695_00126 [Hydrogenophaga sp. T4]|nr:hypothetical protein Y695_00126 [Hydrogenophaga sp. T4]
MLGNQCSCGSRPLSLCKPALTINFCARCRTDQMVHESGHISPSCPALTDQRNWLWGLSDAQHSPAPDSTGGSMAGLHFGPGNSPVNARRSVVCLAQFRPVCGPKDSRTGVRFVRGPQMAQGWPANGPNDFQPGPQMARSWPSRGTKPRTCADTHSFAPELARFSRGFGASACRICSPLSGHRIST